MQGVVVEEEDILVGSADARPRPEEVSTRSSMSHTLLES